MLQDRNIHRDAQALRKIISVPLITPAFGTNQDEPQYVTFPRYNWRLSDLSVQSQALGTGPIIVKAQAVERSAVAGSPQLAQAAAVTFAIEEFWRRAEANSPALLNVAATAAQAFGVDGIATVPDGFWGVWLLVVDNSNNIGVLRQAPIMAFGTEAIALANCPKPRQFQGSGTLDQIGRLAILTVNAVGGDFIAATTNTNDAVVAAFNTAPQDGHVLTLNNSGSPQSFNSVRGTALKDASGANILQGGGNKGQTVLAADDDFSGAGLVVTVRAAGAAVLTGVSAEVEYRPWPAGGEGLGDTSVSQNRPSFAP